MTVLLWLIGLILAAVAAVLGWFALVTRRLAAQAERDIPMKGRLVEVAGEQIHYVDTGGEGRPILFVHGLGGQLQHFEHPLFPALGTDYRLVALDRPGAGYSTRKVSGASIPEQAAVIAAFIDRLGLDRPLVVGHSLGGAIALRLALDFPDRLSGLALLSPRTRAAEETPGAFSGLAIGSPLLRRILSCTIGVPMALKTAPKTLASVFGPREVPADFPIAGGGYLGLRPSQFYNVATDLVETWKDMEAQEKRYGELKMPVGILYGDADRLLDHAQHGLSLEGRIAGLELEILPGVGHMPQFSEPVRTAAFVRRIAAKAFGEPSVPPAARAVADG